MLLFIKGTLGHHGYEKTGSLQLKWGIYTIFMVWSKTKQNKIVLPVVNNLDMSYFFVNLANVGLEATSNKANYVDGL